MRLDTSTSLQVLFEKRQTAAEPALRSPYCRLVQARGRAAIAGILLVAAAAAARARAVVHVPGPPAPGQSVDPAEASSTYPLGSGDVRLLTAMQETAVRYFLEQSDPATGLTRDRAANFPRARRATLVTDASAVESSHGPTSLAQPSGERSAAPAIAHEGPASLAATGFALTAWCIADSRGWIPAGEARRRLCTTLRFAAEHLEQVHGWFYHFVDARSGRHTPDSEVSTIDTALFLQGAIFAREYLHDPEVTRLVNGIYHRIDWRWAENGRLTLAMGWKPGSGFIPYRWDSYCELMGMYLLGLGAPAHALPWEAWDAWRRPRETIAGRTFIQCSPLFTHQYSHAWFDFRGVTDGFADYWRNSVQATLAQRAWSAEQSSRYPHWSKTLWGLTASDGPHGYLAWGTPGPARDESDGTVVPCAPGGSLPFAPRECLADLHHMRQLGGDRLWGRYGFSDAFNPETGWVDHDVIGIDVGITLVMAENLRSGLVWRTFMRAPEVRRGMRVAGFVKERRAMTPSSIASAAGARAGDHRG